MRRSTGVPRGVAERTRFRTASGARHAARGRIGRPQFHCRPPTIFACHRRRVRTRSGATFQRVYRQRAWQAANLSAESFRRFSEIATACAVQLLQWRDQYPHSSSQGRVGKASSKPGRRPSWCRRACANGTAEVPLYSVRLAMRHPRRRKSAHSEPIQRGSVVVSNASSIARSPIRAH
jgi:hypothetical protein